MKEIYHNLKNYMLTALLVLSSSACGSHGNEQSGTDNSDTPAPSKTSFTQGADISWVSEMEKKGLKFYNHEGIETDCFQLMKELGINAIRLRVWVNPKDRRCEQSPTSQRTRSGCHGRLPLQRLMG